MRTCFHAFCTPTSTWPVPQNERAQRRVQSAGAGATQALSQKVHLYRTNPMARAALEERCKQHELVKLEESRTVTDARYGSCDFVKANITSLRRTPEPYFSRVSAFNPGKWADMLRRPVTAPAGGGMGLYSMSGSVLNQRPGTHPQGAPTGAVGSPRNAHFREPSESYSSTVHFAVGTNGGVQSTLPSMSGVAPADSASQLPLSAAASTTGKDFSAYLRPGGSTATSAGGANLSSSLPLPSLKKPNLNSSHDFLGYFSADQDDTMVFEAAMALSRASSSHPRRRRSRSQVFGSRPLGASRASTMSRPRSIQSMQGWGEDGVDNEGYNDDEDEDDEDEEEDEHSMPVQQGPLGMLVATRNTRPVSPEAVKAERDLRIVLAGKPASGGSPTRIEDYVTYRQALAARQRQHAEDVRARKKDIENVGGGAGWGGWGEHGRRWGWRV